MINNFFAIILSIIILLVPVANAEQCSSERKEIIMLHNLYSAWQDLSHIQADISDYYLESMIKSIKTNTAVKLDPAVQRKYLDKLRPAVKRATSLTEKHNQGEY